MISLTLLKSSFSATLNNKLNNNAKSKLRRLKIEENLLVQSLQKLDSKRNNEDLELYFKHDLDYKNVLKNLKDSFINVKNLFNDVKTMTNSQELLAELELEEIKKKVLELEMTLKSFKGYINMELHSLKTTEQELMKQLEEINMEYVNKDKRRIKISSANYNQVVPSPVRLIMTSPFKCTEAQEFQDFMKNSPNRYGGWNEYHHNIFVKYWQKHFGNSSDADFNDPLVETLALENFIEETSFKLQGIERESLMLHINWYKKYLFYKNNQQKAIDKWKSNKISLRKATDKVLEKNFEDEKSVNGLNSNAGDNDINYDNEIACEYFNISKDTKPRLMATNTSRRSQSLETEKKSLKKTKIRRIIKQDDIERLMKPTKQWLNRNYDDERHLRQQSMFVENMDKLCIPTWRKYL